MGLIGVIGLMMLVLLSLYTPWQASRVGEENLRENAGFITNLLAENLSLGIQTLVFDDGESIQDAINMVVQEDSLGEATTSHQLITSVRVFDETGGYLRGYNPSSENMPAFETDSLSLDRENTILFWQPIRDTDSGERLGFLEIEFSKASLAEGVAQLSLDAFLIGLAGFAVVLIIGFLTLQSIVGILRHLTAGAKRVAAGELDVEIQVESRDELGQLADSFNVLIEAQRAKARNAEEISHGNLSSDFEAAGEEDVLGNAMVMMGARINALQKELRGVIAAQKSGDLDARCNSSGFEGAYEEILAGVNDALNSVVQPLLHVSELVGEYAQGDLEREMDALPGKQRVITDSLLTIRNNLRALVEEGTHLAEAVREGQLSIRGDADKFHGGYRDIIEGMNSLLENISAPMNAIHGVLDSMATGNLTTHMEGEWRGDYKIMVGAVDKTLYELNQILGQVSSTVNRVAGGAQQVSSTSDSLSSQATAQASSLEEISASVTEIGQQTRSNADYSKRTEELVESTRSAAEQGNTQMREMLASMNEINESSSQVTKIIKAIEDIAFQTNLLALNAAVEAARAGVHGKGFAVVAGEVRNLAQRSATAAGETADLIQGSNERVAQGASIANDTAASLTKILEGVTEVSELIRQISAASSDQASGVDQVNQSLTQIEQITQQNAAGAEQSAAAAEDLRQLATQLQEMLSKFQLSGDQTGGKELPGHTGMRALPSGR